MLDLISNSIQALLEVIKQFGYLGIFIGMTIESSFFPFPSEVILIPAGALVAKGEFSFFLVFLMGVLGSITGALINYFLALHLGRKAINSLVKRYGKFIFITEEKIEKSDIYFKKHGEITTFVGRLIPGIRQLISIPAGFSKMPLGKFILFTSLGAGLWSFILILLGYFFGTNSELISKNLNLITLSLVLLSLIIIIIYVIYKKKPRSI